MAKSIHLPCKNKPLHTSECSECSQLEHRVEVVEDKLDTIQTGAEVNVQSDWNETDPTSDSYIQNKPNINIQVDSELNSLSTNPVENRVITNALDDKQDELVSGTNIKTINGDSLLGSGNIVIQGGGDKNVWYGTCPTGSNTNQKVATTTSGDFTLTIGNIVSITFSNENGVSASLNVDGTGDVPIRMTSGSSVNALYWTAGETVTFVYNGTYYLAVGKGTATTTYYGVTRLSTSTSSTSTNLAATPSAVKAAYDLANGKQDALVSGTNIKTVNGNSLLGSGDLTIQSGTNITTVTVPITVAAWGGTTVCTVTVNGVTTSNDVIVSPAPTMIPDYVAAGVYCGSQDTNQLEFECSTTPTTALLVHVMIVG